MKNHYSIFRSPHLGLYIQYFQTKVFATRQASFVAMTHHSAQIPSNFYLEMAGWRGWFFNGELHGGLDDKLITSSCGKGHQTGEIFHVLCRVPPFFGGTQTVSLDKMGFENLQFQVSLHVWLLQLEEKGTPQILQSNHGGFQAMLVHTREYRMIHNITKMTGGGMSPKPQTPKLPPQNIQSSNPPFHVFRCCHSPHLLTSGAPKTPGAPRLEGHVLPPAQPQGAHGLSAAPGAAQPCAHRSAGLAAGSTAEWQGWHLEAWGGPGGLGNVGDFEFTLLAICDILRHIPYILVVYGS